MDNQPEQIKQLGVGIDLYLQPLTSIHLHSHTEGEMEPGGNVAYIWIMTTIALFILIIACINFMNLSTAQSVHRAKEVGMRKVLGAQRGKPKVYPFTEADEDYQETLGMELAAGRFFSKEFSGDNKTAVLNESLVKELGCDEPLGKIARMTDMVDGEFKEIPYTVIGVVKDFHFESLREKIRGYVIMLTQEGSRLSVKVRPENISGTIRSLENVWNEMSPARGSSKKRISGS